MQTKSLKLIMTLFCYGRKIFACTDSMIHCMVLRWRKCKNHGCWCKLVFDGNNESNAH